MVTEVQDEVVQRRAARREQLVQQQEVEEIEEQSSLGRITSIKRKRSKQWPRASSSDKLDRASLLLSRASSSAHSILTRADHSVQSRMSLTSTHSSDSILEEARKMRTVLNTTKPVVPDGIGEVDPMALYTNVYVSDEARNSLIA
mmetsp:Transcript_24944/g.50119  ORF Transcript_24944/g.50119 Transcript_24944/m.50119 type:complete len:145 (-) Transcript_24944:82-516(-)